MIPPQVRLTLLRALEQYRSDDLERAQRAFHGLTPAQMEQEYGQSGKSRRAIVKNYEAHVARVNEARQWIEQS